MSLREDSLLAIRNDQMNSPKSDQALSPNDAGALSAILVVVAVIVGLLPYIILVFTFLLAPSYIVPMLNDFGSRLALIGLSIWEIVGIILLIKAARNGFSPTFLAKWSVILIVFVLPLLVLETVGPAIMTIRCAFKTIM